MDLKYEDDVYIDDQALDVEWLNQASLAIKYGRHYANMKNKVRKLEERKKTVRSDLILDANADPKGTCGKGRPNANDIEAYYRQHPDYIEVVQELNEAKHELDFAEIAKNEIAFTRKAALENLVQLQIQGYFAGPKLPRDLSVMREERQQRSNANVAKAMKRKKTE
jgi:hypothetical protein